MLSTIIFICIVSPAHAYLDPGATSIVLQWLVGGVAAATTASSLFSHRIKSFFLNLIKSKKLK